MDHCLLLNPEDQVAWFSLSRSDYSFPPERRHLMIQSVWNRLCHSLKCALREGQQGQDETMSEKMWAIMRQGLSPVLFTGIGGDIEPRNTCFRNNCPLSGREKRNGRNWSLSSPRVYVCVPPYKMHAVC